MKYLFIWEFIDKYGKPNYFVTDNGTEFKDNVQGEYCKNNNIKFIHGLPYRPHSHRVVERLYRVIKEQLQT